ncbi:MAG: PhoH family protein [Erysipelothrix sp.]|nr:PhoH family protein [Erysipelothrix sp.]
MELKTTIALSELNVDELSNLFGVNDRHLAILEKNYFVSILIRDSQMIISGNDELTIDGCKRAVISAIRLIKSNQQLSERDFYYIIRLVALNQEKRLEALTSSPIARNFAGKLIYPKTWGQKIFIDAISRNDITFAIGPAGTGKTYLAVVYAVACLKNQEFKKIILTRPAVEAGENLGFLPGDLKEKVDPYLRPLYDALHDMLGVEVTAKMLEKGQIEIAPLAYMRGRTLDNAFVILDEAQNTLPSQMKMFLTRMGFKSKIIVTGDITQVDLRRDQKSGLIQAVNLLKSIEEIAFVEMTVADVVRHPLVARILEKYESKE